MRPPSSSVARCSPILNSKLYFARFVLLVEGDSERIVLPRLAEALDLLIDPAFVAIVPLGRRHVQHFWRLLTHLGIPHATLLDRDLGRDGGGFGRVTYAQTRRGGNLDVIADCERRWNDTFKATEHQGTRSFPC